MRRQFDSQSKLLFSSREVVRDLLRGFVPIDSLHGLDFTTLEPISEAFVGDDLRQRTSDAVWRIQADGEWIYLYVLLEFQSRVDPSMAVRVAEYVSMLYKKLVRQRQSCIAPHLPPVLPVVVYNGKGEWTAERELSALVAPVHHELAPYQLQQRHVVLDMARSRRKPGARIDNLVAYAIEVENASNPEAISSAMNDLAALTVDNHELERLMLTWTSAVLDNRSDSRMDFRSITTMKELRMAVAEGFQRWLDENSRESLEKGLEQGLEQGLRQGREQGREQGVREGQQRTLRDLLTYRFGSVPDEISARIDCAGISELEIWCRNVLLAESLSDIFRSH